MRIFLLAALLLLILPSAHGQVLEPIWLVGLGGDTMLPVLDGGILEVMVGEKVWLKLMGRDGIVKTLSPDGFENTHYLTDGYATQLSTFNETGTWKITTDDGKTLTVDVEEPQQNIPITFQSLVGNDGNVEMTILQPPRGYALFERTNDGLEIYRPGEEVKIVLEEDLNGPLRVTLVRPGGPLLYQGMQDGRPITVAMPHLIGVYTITPVEVGGRKTLTLRLPERGMVGPGGFEPLRLGQHILQVAEFRESRYSMVLEKTITIVSPELNPVNLSTSISLGQSEALKGITVVVGDELGAVRRVIVEPPIAWLRVFDIVHGEYLDGLELELNNADFGTVNGWTLLTYWRTVTFERYVDGEVLRPVRSARVSVVSNGFRTESVMIDLSPGVKADLPVQLYRLYVDLVFSNGTKYAGTASLEVGGRSASLRAGDYLILPRGVYQVRSLNPPSFTYASVVLEGDKGIVIYLVEDLLLLSALRATAIVLGSVLAYQLFRMKVFGRMRALK